MPSKIAAKKIPDAMDKNTELQRLIAEMNKKFGANAVTLGVPKDPSGNIKTLQRLNTGSIVLDIALGGGLPIGRFIEISGAYSSTKTTQALHIVREAQKRGFVCAFLDVEGTTDEKFMKDLGIDTESLLYSQPDGMEEATQLLLDMQRSGEVNLAVLDTIAAMSPNKEQEISMDETMRMGIPQQLLSEFFRKFQANNNRLNREGKLPFTLIGLNQLREKIGGYGDNEYTPGGRAKGFASSVDIRLRRGDWIAEGTGDNKEIVGQVVKFKIEKNKTYKRMQTGEFDFYFAENSAGVPIYYNDNIKEIIMCAVEWGVIERAGAWFSYDNQKYQGLSALMEALRNNDEITAKIKAEILNLVEKRTD